MRIQVAETTVKDRQHEAKPTVTKDGDDENIRMRDDTEVLET